jgi:hypothetical protein
MPIAYTAVTRFDLNCENWQKYIDWSRLTQLREVISLDSILCPTVVQELTDEDWQYNVHEDYKTHVFRDLDYLLRKVDGNEPVNVLAVMQEPTTEDLRSFTDPRFVFRGFDLTDSSISALLNCGRFDRAFSSSDLSEYGLLTDHAKALKVQQLLRSEYPDEPQPTATCGPFGK